MRHTWGVGVRILVFLVSLWHRLYTCYYDYSLFS